jgi:hypothetical protein
LGVRLLPESLTDLEKRGAAQLEQHKYCCSEWSHQGQTEVA